MTDIWVFRMVSELKAFNDNFELLRLVQKLPAPVDLFGRRAAILKVGQMAISDTRKSSNDFLVLAGTEVIDILLEAYFVLFIKETKLYIKILKIYKSTKKCLIWA